MTEKSASPVATAEEKVVTKTESTRKIAAPKAAAKPRTKPTHPSTADMVKAAINTLSERGGSSLQAIKKYITATYKIDAEKQAPFIKKYLKAAVTAGTLVQTKGKGASGSFKLAVKKADSVKAKTKKAAGEKKIAKPKKPASPKKSPVKKAEAVKAVTKKPASPKKAPVKKAPAAEKKTAAKSPAAASKVAKTKAPSKAKKAAKSPTAKPKVPKPKKAAAPKVAKTAAKKPAAQKK